MNFVDELQPESDQEEEGVVDFTHQHYDNTVRISNGFKIEQLTEGVIFNPEELDPANNNEGFYSAAARDPDDLVNLLEGKGLLEDDEEDEGEAGEFKMIKKGMKDITPDGDGGVLKRTEKAGIQSQPAVPERAVVTIHYSFYLEHQDEPFDSTLIRGKAEKHKIGVGQLLEGLEMGIRTMRKGEKAEMLIDYRYGMGEYGCPPRIPGKALIFAIVELIDYTEESQADSILSIDREEREKKYSFDDLEKIAQLENSNGNNFFRENDYVLALKCYERGQKLLEGIHLANEDQETRCHKLLKKSLLNIAISAIKLQRPKKACIACREVLKIEESAKALLRFGIAKRQLGDYEAAKDLMLKAQRRAPQNSSVSEELMKLEDVMMHERKMEAAMCKNMFKNVVKVTKEPKVNLAIVNIYYEDFKEFREDPDRDVYNVVNPVLVAKDLKEIRKAAADLDLKVQLMPGKGKANVVQISK